MNIVRSVDETFDLSHIKLIVLLFIPTALLVCIVIFVLALPYMLVRRLCGKH